MSETGQKLPSKIKYSRCSDAARKSKLKFYGKLATYDSLNFGEIDTAAMKQRIIEGVKGRAGVRQLPKIKKIVKRF